MLEDDPQFYGQKTLTGPATRWFAVVPGPDDLPILPRALHVNSGGDLVIEGEDGHSETFSVLAGQSLAVRPCKVLGATTAVVVALY